MMVPLDSDTLQPHDHLAGNYPLHVWMAWAIWRQFNEYNYPSGRHPPQNLLDNDSFVAFSKHRVTDWDDYGT